MKKLSLSVIGMYLMMAHAFSQGPEMDSTGYIPKKLKLDEVNLVTSYYNQTANKSAVMGGDPGPKGIADVTDFANGLDLKFQLLFWPVTNAYFETESYNKFSESRFLTKNMMLWFWDNYISKPEHRNEIYASPLKASVAQLKGLPPAMVQVAENDVLRDEGEAYARKMDEGGVDVTLLRVQGMIHDYGLLNPIANVPAVQSALRTAATELRKALL